MYHTHTRAHHTCTTHVPEPITHVPHTYQSPSHMYHTRTRAHHTCTTHIPEPITHVPHTYQSPSHMYHTRTRAHHTCTTHVPEPITHVPHTYQSPSHIPLKTEGTWPPALCKTQRPRPLCPFTSSTTPLSSWRVSGRNEVSIRRREETRCADIAMTSSGSPASPSPAPNQDMQTPLLHTCSTCVGEVTTGPLP